jgi:hypothetical protein
MSWSMSTCGTRKELAGDGTAPGLIETTPTSPAELDEHMAKQHAAARVVALQLIEQVPGPRIAVSLSGHANGVGDVAKPGWANDCINISVSQVTP